MNEDRIEGAAKVVGGRFQKATGKVLDDADMQARGDVRAGLGHIQEAAGVTQDFVEEAVDRMKTTIESAEKAFDAALNTIAGVRRTIEERSYLAVAAAGALGLFMGLLLASRGPKVIYVKPRA